MRRLFRFLVSVACLTVTSAGTLHCNGGAGPQPVPTVTVNPATQSAAPLSDVHASDIAAELNEQLKGKSTDGYTIRDWEYKKGDSEFVISVSNGQQWHEEYVKSGGMPEHGQHAAMTAALIIEQHAITPLPKTYIFKDGDKELYRLSMDELTKRTQAELREFIERQQRR